MFVLFGGWGCLYLLTWALHPSLCPLAGDGAGGGPEGRMEAIWDIVLDCAQSSTLAWSCAKDRWGIGMGGEGLRRVGDGAGGGPEGRMEANWGIVLDCAQSSTGRAGDAKSELTADSGAIVQKQSRGAGGGGAREGDRRDGPAMLEPREALRRKRLRRIRTSDDDDTGVGASDLRKE